MLFFCIFLHIEKIVEDHFLILVILTLTAGLCSDELRIINFATR